MERWDTQTAVSARHGVSECSTFQVHIQISRQAYCSWSKISNSHLFSILNSPCTAQRSKLITKTLGAEGLHTDLISENADPTQMGLLSRLCRASPLQAEPKSNGFKSLECARQWFRKWLSSSWRPAIPPLHQLFPASVFPYIVQLRLQRITHLLGGTHRSWSRTRCCLKCSYGNHTVGFKHLILVSEHLKVFEMVGNEIRRSETYVGKCSGIVRRWWSKTWQTPDSWWHIYLHEYPVF